MSDNCIGVETLYSKVPAETALDVLENDREFACSENGSERILVCQELNVCTHDYRETKGDDFTFEPRVHVRIPPVPWDQVAVSAHSNTLEVARFLKDELEHDGLDGNGKEYASFVRYPHDTAFWLPKDNGESGVFVYGQRSLESNDNSTYIYYAAGKTVVAHEIFHGVTHFTANLEGRNEPGALNESYSDIFGVLFKNNGNLDIDSWNWEIGVPGGNGNLSFPIRDLKQPERFNQPEHNKDYNYTLQDNGGVHINNGIHNKAAYNLLVAKDSKGCYLFNAGLAGFLFYQALLNLTATSGFSASRLQLTMAIGSYFSVYDTARQPDALTAVNQAFDAVGIK